VVRATSGDAVTESAPLDVEVAELVPLELYSSLDKTQVYAGSSAYLKVVCENKGIFASRGVTARLVDDTGNLGVQLQTLGDIEPGESREFVFVVEVPRDFPADVVSSLRVQTISQDGSTSESPALPLTIVCVPEIQVLAEMPPGQIKAGQSVEIIALVRNTGQCMARDVSVAVGGLPPDLPQPPAQTVPELPPGEERLTTFNLLVPEGYPQ